MSETQVERYEAWIRRIEDLQQKDARNRPTYFRIFLAIPAVLSLGFFCGVWFGVASLLTGLLMCMFGFYTFLTIEGDYERELEGLRRSVDELRAIERSLSLSREGEATSIEAETSAKTRRSEGVTS